MKLKISAFIIAIMDNTTQKDDRAKRFAANTSALFLKHLVYDDVLR